MQNCWRTFQVLAISAVLGSSALPVSATPFDCTQHCGVKADGPYPNLVVGTIDGVASPEQSKKLFATIRKTGYWKTLPQDPGEFYKAIQPVSIRLQDGQSLTFLISQEEAQASPLIAGDLVRFTPHRGVYEKPPDGPPAAIAYWNATGCVAVLCREQDTACTRRYRSGIFGLDGSALKADGRSPDSDGIRIDPHSMLPK